MEENKKRKKGKPKKIREKKIVQEPSKTLRFSWRIVQGLPPPCDTCLCICVPIIFSQHHPCCKIFFHNNTRNVKMRAKKLHHHICWKKILQHELYCTGLCNTAIVAMVWTMLGAGWRQI